MAQILELAHLVEQHGVAQMQIRRGRIETGLDPKRAAELQARFQLLRFEDFLRTAADQFEYFLHLHANFAP